MRTHVITAALCAALGGQARAVQLQADHHSIEGPPLSLKAAVEEALEHNPNLTALRQQIETGRQRPAQERALMPPMAEATVWQWPITSLNPANTNMYMFMVAQDLPGRGKRDLRASVAEKDIALAQTDVTVRARQMVDEVKQAYATLFIARKATDVHLASVDLLRQIADVSQAKYATGRISQQDVLKPVVELSKLHGDLLMFDEQAGIATARLNVLLGRSPEGPIGTLTEPVERTLVATSGELQRLAIEHQPELQRAHLEIDRAEAELASAKREYKPDFTVQGGYLLLPGQTDAWLGRVGMTWPRAPWSRGKISARITEQIAAAETAKARERAMQNMVRLAVQEAYVRALSEFEQATADLERAVGADLPEGTTVNVTNQPPRSPSTPGNSSVGALGGLNDGGVR